MDDALPSIGQLTTAWVEFLTVAGAIVLVILLAFFWALFIRKPGTRRRKRRHHHHRRPGIREALSQNGEDRRSRRRGRGRRRERRALNPTLAETGGLPPIREPSEPPPPSRPS